MSARVLELLSDERERRRTVLVVRQRNYLAAKRAFVLEAPGSVGALIDASEKYVATLEAELMAALQREIDR